MLIRRQTPKDSNSVYSLIKTAFETAQVKDGTEQDYFNRLINGPAFIPELALVAEDKGEILGQVLITKTNVNQPCGAKFEALMLGPVSVLLEHRSKAIGAHLIKEALKTAKELGYKAVFLVGNPAYYSRFGFKQTSLYGISHDPFIPEQFVQVLELQPGSLSSVSGTINLG